MRHLDQGMQNPTYLYGYRHSTWLDDSLLDLPSVTLTQDLAKLKR